MNIRPKKIICYRCAKIKKVVAGAFNFFFENRGFPENFWNSQEFLGIPKISGNSRGDFLNFGKNKKKNVVAPKSGKKVVAAQR